MIESVEKTVKHIFFLARHFDRKCIHQVVIILLLELGVPRNLDGFDYLAKAITIYCENPTRTNMKGLYQAVVRLYGQEVEDYLVDSSIRNAIRLAWKNRDEDAWALYFPYSIRGRIKKPSNAEFIAGIAWALELWKGCCRRYEKDDREVKI